MLSVSDGENIHLHRRKLKRWPFRATLPAPSPIGCAILAPKMSWWSKLWKGFGGEPKNAPEKPRSEPAEWLAADDPGNPFDVPILDLMSNLGVTSTTQDPALAERSVSWRAGQHERLAWKLDGERFSCDLSYDAATSLPDGMLFVPAAMEDKWVIAWRHGKIAAARSWTGATEAIGEAHLEAGRLRISSLSIAASSTLRALGDPVGTFDWLIKSHALNERIPLPVSAEGAEILRGVPLASFGPFGHQSSSVTYSSACQIATGSTTSWTPTRENDAVSCSWQVFRIVPSSYRIRRSTRTRLSQSYRPNYNFGERSCRPP
jgi:hypothetical protein